MASTDALTTNADYIGWRLEIFTGFWVPIQVFAVTLRYWSRSLIHFPWGIDDSLVLLTLIIQLIMAGIGIGAVKNGGMGYHTAYLEAVDPPILLRWGKYLVAISTLYFFVVNIPKLAILILYLRLFPTRWARITAYILIAILCGASIVNPIAALASCQPFAANWDPHIPGAHCDDKEKLFIWTSVPSIVTDIVMLVFSLPIIWKLQCNTRMKIGLTITFLFGSFGLVTSVLRFTSFFKNNSFTDGTWTGVELMIWTQTEPGTYLISACLVTYRPLLEKVGVGKLTAIVVDKVVRYPPVIRGTASYQAKVYGEKSRQDHDKDGNTLKSACVSFFKRRSSRADEGNSSSDEAAFNRSITVTKNIEVYPDGSDVDLSLA